MGIIRNGINGSFSGTVGTVVGGTWNGIPFIRSKASTAKKRTFTPAQIAQQQKFRVAARFANSLTTLLDLTFRNLATNKTGRNSAISYLIKRAVMGSSPDFQLDYTQVLISRGDLLGAEGAVASAGTGGQINFTWADNTNTGHARPSDRAIVVAHCPALNQSLYAFPEATRRSGTAILDTSAFSGRTVHTWLGFISKNGKEVADSVYTGALVMS